VCRVVASLSDAVKGIVSVTRDDASSVRLARQIAAVVVGVTDRAGFEIRRRQQSGKAAV